MINPKAYVRIYLSMATFSFTPGGKPSATPAASGGAPAFNFSTPSSAAATPSFSLTPSAAPKPQAAGAAPASSSAPFNFGGSFSTSSNALALAPAPQTCCVNLQFV